MSEYASCVCSICLPPPEDEPRCPVCGYTEDDALVHGDHSLCAGVIPKREPPKEGT